MRFVIFMNIAHTLLNIDKVALLFHSSVCHNNFFHEHLGITRSDYFNLKNRMSNIIVDGIAGIDK